ncbi:hypothetical protein [Silvimonas sp.]|uniref:hypothetical protein n=1 Tax=Silvimonas sp. TaxID=2650811 RepID=UPI00284A1351|nr:hypothetical protein [Silvimonas sp.]MDR3428084.1 hypothetical protein [Silvimonas sp.]
MSKQLAIEVILLFCACAAMATYFYPKTGIQAVIGATFTFVGGVGGSLYRESKKKN